MPLSPPPVRSLAEVPIGTSGTLALGGLPRAAALRLARVGLRVGAPVTVLARTAGGGRLLATGATRIGLDRDTARRLEVLSAGAGA
ncbi:FeoA family protein [Geodermatophilus sp. TF02-6]|uniref:FeoA family protein n=1 Tax=Geodermatophilus sp. TF02-6 TaxID=2250575 RepID=UPI001314B103|nr:FeoA family protein [Geodermatophilus sp. TF02-6]